MLLNPSQGSLSVIWPHHLVPVLIDLALEYKEKAIRRLLPTQEVASIDILAKALILISEWHNWSVMSFSEYFAQSIIIPGKQKVQRTRRRIMRLRKLMIPVLLSLLILLSASPLVQAYSAFFYVIPTSAPLRECAAPECDVLLTAYQGDKVEILERTSAGWSRVRLVDRTGIGWIPSDLLSYSPDLQAKPTPLSYVNTSSLPLRQHPTPAPLSSLRCISMTRWKCWELVRAAGPRCAICRAARSAGYHPATCPR